METFTFIVQSALLNMDIVMYILLGTLVIAVLASVLFRFCKLSNILIFANTVTIFAIGVLFIILYSKLCDERKGFEWTFGYKIGN